jgi:hypothetical protein
MAYKSNKAHYQIYEANDDRIVIEDIGPWDRYMTVTNAAESVIEELGKQYGGIGKRRVFYYDSEGEMTELLVKDGKFMGFAPVSQD